MALTPATNKQVPEHAIMDLLGKQPYLGNQFMAATNSVSLTGTTEAPLLYLACPTAAVQGVGASQNAKSIFCCLKNMYCSDVSGVTGIVYRIYFGATSVSAGTALTPANMRPANANVSIATATKSPTVGGNGTFAYGYSVGFLAPAVSRELIILDPGYNMLITAKPTADSTAIVDLSWYEI